MKQLFAKERVTHLAVWPDDITRIVKVCKEYGYEISREDACRAWEDVSELYAASWLILPKDDHKLVQELLRVCIIKEA